MYKLIARDRKQKDNIKKRIYETTKSFNTYAFDIIDRYSNWYKVEVYKLSPDLEWTLIKEFEDKQSFNKEFGKWKHLPKDITFEEMLKE